MYVKPEGRRPFSKPDIFIPENYSGNAFSEKEAPEPVEVSAVAEAAAEKPSLLGSISSEELLLLGVILLLSQEDGGQDLLPILLILLFLK